MWILESNRIRHFIYAIPCAMLLTMVCVIGLALGMEFKDEQHGGNWDWLDWLATILGGLIGQLLQVLFVWLIFL